MRDARLYFHDSRNMLGFNVMVHLRRVTYGTMSAPRTEPPERRPQSRRTGIRTALVMAAAALTAGCSTYRELPLAATPGAPTQLKDLQVDASQLGFRSLKTHRFDASDGLDAVEVEMLAVVQNPALRVARADLGVAKAQAFAAGLLPDPQVSLSRDFPRNGGPGATTAFNLGASLDISALIQASAARDAAGAALRKVRLNLLWQEWQTMTEARLLFARVRSAQQQLKLLRDTKTLFQQRQDKLDAALSRGDVTLDATAPNETALQDVRRQINDLERQLSKSRLDLNALLGVSPELDLPLVGEPDVPTLDPAQVAAALGTLPQRRGDLLALQAGYAEQEARVRQAILAQFPVLNFGVSRARDTAGLFTNGFSVGFTLPLFNFNRGNIAIEKATRERLAVEYQARLNATHDEVVRNLQDLKLVQSQIERTKDGVAQLQQASDRAAQALGSRGIDVLTYTSLRSALLAREAELITLRQSSAELRIAVSALLGTRDFQTQSAPHHD